MNNIYNRRVLIEKNPLKVKIAFKDIRITRDDGWWYAEHFGEFFYVTKAGHNKVSDLNVSYYSDDDIQIEVDKIFIVLKGEFAGHVIQKNDCKIISGN